MHEVEIGTREVEPLAELVGQQRWAEVLEAWEPARSQLEGQTAWHVNATATGGGVAEMLTAILPLWSRLGIEARWLVLDGEPTFFATTKRLHNFLHGFPGDGGDLGEAERENYQQVLAANLEGMRERVKPGDIVILHDPQTAGLVQGVKDLGAHVIWRSHIGRDEPNEQTERGWAFLEPYLRAADRVIVSRLAYAPPSVPFEKIAVVTPCIDPFTAKNAAVPDDIADRVLVRAGLLEDGAGGPIEFPRRDGSTGIVRPHASAALDGGPLPEGARTVLQVSRWDHLKDMPGVMRGFVRNVTAPDAHLVLCGPAVEGVTDDPEGAQVLQECRDAFRELSPEMRKRVHLFCIPMDDVDENAYIVNALQQHAEVIVQKSLFEGFGLTVTEAMWKARPVVASAIGGIQDQIEHGINGMLLRDATDVDALGQTLNKLLNEPGLSRRLGAAARAKVLRRFLGDGSIYSYGRVMSDLFAPH